MADDMFFSENHRSLRRGKRAAKRTPTFRPCLVWPTDAPEMRMQGVVMDASPFGMLVRLAEPLPVGTDLCVQLMRDDSYQQALATPTCGTIVRQEPARGAFTNHGVRLFREEIAGTPARPIKLPSRPFPRPSAPAASPAPPKLESRAPSRTGGSSLRERRMRREER